MSTRHPVGGGGGLDNPAGQSAAGDNASIMGMMERLLPHSLQLQVYENLREKLRKDEEHAADCQHDHDGDVASYVEAISLFEDKLLFYQPECSSFLHDSFDLSFLEIVSNGAAGDLQTILYTRPSGCVNRISRRVPELPWDACQRRMRRGCSRVYLRD